MSERTKSLCRYIFPAMGGLFVTYLYNVVDGIFVGQGVGAAALGAVNIGVPFITFVVAMAAMFPMGGATVAAIRMGRGDKDGANHAFMTAFALTAFLSAILMVVGMLFSQQIVDMSGAYKLSNAMRKMAADYLFYYSAFSIPMLMSTCLSVFVRNDGSPTLSFVGMCAGAVANIFLDWLFIFPLGMGVTGAAVASGLGQVFSVLVLLTHFRKKKGNLRIEAIKFDVTLIKKICKRGMPEAISQLTTPVTALCYNLMLASLIGDIGVSTFSVLSFIYSLANAILSGVAQGLQPLWGNCYGRRSTNEINWFLRCGVAINIILSIWIYGILFTFDKPIIHIFNQDASLVQTAAAALPLFSLAFIPMAVNLVYTAFMFSTKRTIQANAIAICRGIIIKAVAIFCIPLLFGSNAIWIAPFIAETFTLILSLALSKWTPLVYI
ncbi:MAG: MATE family efflux transporter [Clostridiales bacterium]|nr:MATE family efflux transporter [Clostridiales bacterium]